MAIDIPHAQQPFEAGIISPPGQQYPSYHYFVGIDLRVASSTEDLVGDFGHHPLGHIMDEDHPLQHSQSHLRANNLTEQVDLGRHLLIEAGGIDPKARNHTKRNFAIDLSHRLVTMEGHQAHLCLVSGAPASRIMNKVITGDESATMQKAIRVISRNRFQHLNLDLFTTPGPSRLFLS
jgi:hypothetical protein